MANLSYDDLPEDRSEVFWEIPGVDFFDNATEREYAQELYADAFGFTADEYDAMGIDANSVHAAREEFFDYMGLAPEDFPWDEWREAMGYE